jgi:hypothetical protein
MVCYQNDIKLQPRHRGLDLYRAFYLYFSAFYLRTLEPSQYGAGHRKDESD